MAKARLWHAAGPEAASSPRGIGILPTGLGRHGRGRLSDLSKPPLGWPGGSAVTRVNRELLMQAALPSTMYSLCSPRTRHRADGVGGCRPRRFVFVRPSPGGTARLKQKTAGPATRVNSKGAFTLVEALVVVAILATLFALLVPAFRSAREASERATCLGKLRQVSAAVNSFALDNNDCYPRSYDEPGAGHMNWWHYIAGYVGGTRVILNNPRGPLTCPACYNARFQQTGSRLKWANYGANTRLFVVGPTRPPVRRVAVRRPSKTIMIMCGDWTTGTPLAWLPHPLQSPDCHAGGRNILYADGHVEWWKNARTTLSAAPYAPGGAEDAWSP